MAVTKCPMVLGFFLLAMQVFPARSEDVASTCHNEDTLVLVWSSQQVVRDVDYKRRPPTMEVNWRQWMMLPFNFQANIALSAFCRVKLTDPNGVLEVIDQRGALLGSVKGGEWRNLITGD